MTQTIQQIEKSEELTGYILVHRAIERNLRLLEEHSQAQVNPSIEKAKKISDWWNLLWDIIETHHKVEDNVAFPAYFSRDPGITTVMESLTADHHVLDDLVIQIKSCLEIVRRPGEHRTGVYRQYLETLNKFNTLMFAHLSREEVIVISAENTLFTPEEKVAFEQSVIKSTPMKILALEAPFMFYRVDPEIENDFMKKVPVFLKVIYKLSWKGKFAKRMAGYMAA